MPLVLAVEPDLRQASILTRVIRDQVHAEVIVVDSRDAAISALAGRTPDVVLLTALLSPRDEEELVAHLRRMPGAEHVQTHTIPQLASATGGAEAPASGGLLGKFRRKKESAPVPGCDPSLFAEEVRAFLARASQLKVEAAAEASGADQDPSFRPVDAELISRGGPVHAEQIAAEPAPEEPGGSDSWSSPFEWRRSEPLRVLSEDSHQAEAAVEQADAAIEEEPAPPAPQRRRHPTIELVDDPQDGFEVVEESDDDEAGDALDVTAQLEALAAEERERAQLHAEAEAERERLRREAEREIERERERVRLETEAAIEWERQRVEAEAAAERERLRIEAEAAAERERRRLEAEMAEERERLRIEAEAAAERERRRIEAEAAAERERLRREAEAAAARERQRLEAQAAAEKERLRREVEASSQRERQRLEAAAAAERERLRLEAEAEAAAERERLRLDAEAAAERERLRVESEAAAERERLRLETEAAAERERRRLDAEAAAERKRLRLEAEAAAERERQRLDAEAAAQRERLRLEVEAAAERERLRLEVEAAAERERLLAEAEALAEQERLRRDAEAAAERERLRLEAQADFERQQRRLEEEAAAERDRLRTEAEAKARQRRALRKASASLQRELLATDDTPSQAVEPEPARPAPPDDPFAAFRVEADELEEGILRLMPLAMWAHHEKPAPEPGVERVPDDLAELMAALSLPPQVAGVSYARGCRIRRVRVPASGSPKQPGTPPVILSRRALEETRAGRS